MIYTSNLYLDNNPYYSYSTILNKVSYNIVIRYSTRDSNWYLDLFSADNEPLVLATRLVPNYPLLADFIVPTLSGYFLLFPTEEVNISKLITEPENIADYFELVYVYDV